MRQQRPRVVSENRAQLSRAALLPLEHSSLHPTFKESLFQELTEPRVNFDPSGKQRKGRQEEAVDVGRQQQAGGPGQHSHGSAPGTVTPAGTGPVLSPAPAKGGPQLPGAGAHLCWATLPHVCASESSSRPSFPSRYLARSLRVTIPTTSLRLSTTTKCRRPSARKSLNTRGRDASWGTV